MSDSVTPFEVPKRGNPPIRCVHCGGELEAVGEHVAAITTVRGLRWFVWRHVATQQVQCTTVHDAEVRDDWWATAAIEHADTG